MRCLSMPSRLVGCSVALSALLLAASDAEAQLTPAQLLATSVEKYSAGELPDVERAVKVFHDGDAGIEGEVLKLDRNALM